MNNLLAGDIGGTKTILSLHEVGPAASSVRLRRTFKNSAYESFGDIAEQFLEEANAVAERVCLAVAGPVTGSRVLMTNVGWMVDGSEIGARLGATDVWLLNDVEALAWAVPDLNEAQLRTLNEGNRSRDGNMALLAAGTGCGEAQLIWDGHQYLAVASEGGHCDFAPTDATQVRLLQFLRGELRHVSVERVCSGMGIYNIYRFLRDGEGIPEERWLAQEVQVADDPARVIGEAGAEGKSKLCVETLRLFAAILAAEAGNLGLRCLATGGVFIGGGIPSRVLSFLEEAGFLAAYVAKGRFQSALEQIPLHVILDSGAALAGAARYGIARLNGANG